jgi:3-hydroxyisobutyrate dehydrogenase-like beta-hydroxyacid dehydrogenase
MEDVMDVGLIGLGSMGTGIAKSLLRAGHRLTVYNRTRERAEALRKDGATVASSVAEACHADAVLTMLADDAAVEAVVFGESGILKSLKRGHAHISLSTISVALSERLTAEHSKVGQEFIASPVFGRPEAAEAAKLAVVAAGPKAAVERFKPLWEAMGQKLLVIGEQPPKANVVKLTGNFLIASVLESLGEAMAFARKSGVDATVLLEFLTSTLFNAPVYKTYGGLIVEGKHDHVGFALPLGFKDVRLVMQAAEAKTVPMPIASVLHDRFVQALARGYGHMDWSVIGQVAAEDAGLVRAKSA